MSAPAVIIELPLEAAPRILSTALNDAEQARLVDWLRARGLLELVAAAAEAAGALPSDGDAA